MQTYLVEHYRPGLDAEALQKAAAVIRTAAGTLGPSGSGVRYLRSTIVPTQEAFLSVFEAPSETAVRDAYTRAGLAFEQISVVLEDELS